jgi:hypothetical protein
MTDTTFLERLQEIAGDITLGLNCEVRVEEDSKGVFVQIKCHRKDVITGDWGWGFGGKAYPSEHSTLSEITQLIFGLFKGYWEHEARENFTYKGYRVYNPHINVEALMTVARKVDVRSAKHVEDAA